MVATIARSGPGFTTSNVRTYDVWGGVRTGASTGGPKGRYVANLGHVQDDESGLIYMRARYYEPESGRFISEDPAMDGSNWFSYANNDPVNNIDRNGNSAEITAPPWFGPAGRYLWLFSVILGVIAVGAIAISLAKFVVSLASAKDSIDVEDGWAHFMSDFKSANVLNQVDTSGSLGRGLTLLRWILSTVSNLGRSSSSSGVAQTVVSGAIVGAQAAMLCYGYQRRILWYLGDTELAD